MYKTELHTLKQKDRFRQRTICKGYADFSSNDYLGFASDKKQLEKAYKTVLAQDYFAPRASQLVCGYAPIHAKFEKLLTSSCGYESALLMGSGFLANLALVSTLPRRGDLVLMDSDYHASGVMGAENCKAEVEFFAHNDSVALEEKLKNSAGHKRIFVFVEGVYSMIGDILEREIINIADKYEAILVVDEAHSVGVLGDSLLGVFDHYGITPKPNHIKMGTLGKALGSFGAYILASSEIISFLENRSRPFIYATALSLFDTALAYHNFKKMLKNSAIYRHKLSSRTAKFSAALNDNFATPIAMIESIQNQTRALHSTLIKEKIMTGFIRPPTVSKPSIRAVIGLSSSEKQFETLLSILTKHKVKKAY